MEESGKTILLVDDDRISLKMLELYVSKLGHHTVVCDSGEAALEKLEDLTPDLVLLDYIMPGMSGDDVCRKIKLDPRFEKLPVIFISSLETTDSLVHAFDAGAVDYIIKPVNPRELMVRLRTHLELSDSRNKLELYGRQMEALVQERTRQLLHADRLATLGTLSAGIAHEINNPSTFISGNIQTLERFWQYLLTLPGLGTEKDRPEKLHFIISEMPGVLDGMKNGVNRIKRIVDSLKTYARKNKPATENVALADILQEVAELCRNNIKKAGMQIVADITPPDLHIWCEAQQIEQVLINLVVNACDAVGGIPQPKLYITARNQGNNTVIHVRDTGSGAPQEVLDKIWDPFFTTKEPGKGTGLGLSISRNIMENHSGSIDAHNAPEGGLEFTLTLPVAKSS